MGNYLLVAMGDSTLFFHDLEAPSRSGTKRYPPNIGSSAGEPHSGT